MRKAFNDIDAKGRNAIGFQDLASYFCDYIGFGQLEVIRFFEEHAADEEHLTFDNFRQGYASLNPYQLAQRQKEVIVRKPGSISGEQVNLMKLEDCEVYVCDKTAQVFADYCKRSLVLLGPCESSVFVRDCEDCIFWVAAQQLRTSDCHRCTFYLYTRTEPVIEKSDNLAFAPWAARYPKCVSQFREMGFDPQRNLWNAIFDFSGEVHRSHWRILPLAEVQELTVEFEDGAGAAAESPTKPITHNILCAAPLASGGSCGQGVVNIPQTRPPLPAQPTPSASVRKYTVRDGEPDSCCGAERLAAASGSPVAAPHKQGSLLTSAATAAAAAASTASSLAADDLFDDDGLEVIDV